MPQVNIIGQQMDATKKGSSTYPQVGLTKIKSVNRFRIAQTAASLLVAIWIISITTTTTTIIINSSGSNGDSHKANLVGASKSLYPPMDSNHRAHLVSTLQSLSKASSPSSPVKQSQSPIYSIYNLQLGHQLNSSASSTSQFKRPTRSPPIRKKRFLNSLSGGPGVIGSELPPGRDYPFGRVYPLEDGDYSLEMANGQDHLGARSHFGRHHGNSGYIKRSMRQPTTSPPPPILVDIITSGSPFSHDGDGGGAGGGDGGGGYHRGAITQGIYGMWPTQVMGEESTDPYRPKEDQLTNSYKNYYQRYLGRHDPLQRQHQNGQTFSGKLASEYNQTNDGGSGDKVVVAGKAEVEVERNHQLQQQRCEASLISAHLERDEYDKTSGDLIRSCQSVVQLNKCEGFCLSFAHPSLRSPSGFHKSCNCCRESIMRKSLIQLTGCFNDQGLRIESGPKSTMTVEVDEPVDCKCVGCSSEASN